MKMTKPIVLIAGASGYLGRYLTIAYARAGYRVRALVRNPDKLKSGIGHFDQIYVGEATKRSDLIDVCDGVDLVVSALGITRQMDGFNYAQVDYQANRNLLDEALKAEVKRFAYIHVLNANQMSELPMVRAKIKFARELEAAPIPSTILSPSGFFRDVFEVLDMAAKGRVFIFGDGHHKISPIHGADLAQACVQATQDGLVAVDVGGPETFTQNQIAALAFFLLGKPMRLVHIPFWVGDLGVRLARVFGLGRKVAPLAFFIKASKLDMRAPAFGNHLLSESFKAGIAENMRASRVSRYSILPDGQSPKHLEQQSEQKLP